MPKHARRVAAIIAPVALLVSLSTAALSATALKITAVPGPSGPTEVARQISFARDVGISTVLNGKSYWLFGDTYVPASTVAGTPSFFVGGSTAAVSATITLGRAPSDLQEIRVGQLAPWPLPTRFLPQSRVTYIPGQNGVPCSGGSDRRSVRWITGATAAPAALASNSLFVTYVSVCAQTTATTVEGWGFALFDTTLNLWSNVTDVMLPGRRGVELPERLRYGWPLFNRDGTVTFFSHGCARSSVVFLCTNTTLYSTSFPATLDNLADHNRYDAVPILDNPRGMDAALFAMSRYTVGDKDTYYYFRQDDLGGAIELFKSTQATGPYYSVGTAALPGCSQLDPELFCYALTPHAELSTSSGLLLTYYVPRGNGLTDHLASAWVQLPVPPPTTTTTTTRPTTTTTTTRPTTTTTTTRPTTTTTTTRPTTTTTTRPKTTTTRPTTTTVRPR